MAAAEPASARLSLRTEREETSRIAWAMAVSVCIHLLLFGTYQVGKKYDLWDTTKWPKWVQPPRLLTEVLKKPLQPPNPPEEQVPLMFVEVNPAVATPEPPKDTPYYAALNSKAANPDPKDDTNVPRIDGRQDQMVKTEDVKREQVTKLQPVAPTPEPEPEPAREEVKPQPKPVEKPGDLAMVKPQTEPQVAPVEPRVPRPRTVREALARQQQASRIPGEKMRQDGGVRRRLEVASLDAKATPFGTYDQMMVEAISQRWFSLLDQREYASDGRGKVVLQFVLHHNGRVTDVEIADNSAGEVLGLICQKAVMDPAPYSPWPGDMRRMVGDTRKIQFTFYYN